MPPIRLHRVPKVGWLTGCFVFILGLLPLTGCGTGEYVSRTEASVKLLNDSAGGMLINAEPVVDTTHGVSIRLPKCFNAKPFTWRSGARTEQGIVSPEVRLHPPLRSLEGHIFTYESAIELKSGDKLPIYCFVAVNYKQAPDAALQNVRSHLAGGIIPPQTNAPIWTDTTLVNSKGEKQAWKVLEMRGNQVAELTATGYVNTKTMESFSRIYAYQGKGYQMFVGWRAPIAALAPLNFLQAIEASTGTATLDMALRAGATNAAWPTAKAFTLPAQYTLFGRGRMELQLPSAFNEKSTVQIGGIGTMPFTTLPGYRLTYTNFVVTSKNTLEPVYFYLGSVNKTHRTARDYIEQIHGNIKATNPAYTGVVEQISNEWSRIRFEGDQPFYFSPVGGKDLEAPGVFEIYVGNESDDVLVMAFRTTATVAQETNFLPICHEMLKTKRMNSVPTSPGSGR